MSHSAPHQRTTDPLLGSAGNPWLSAAPVPPRTDAAGRKGDGTPADGPAIHGDDDSSQAAPPLTGPGAPHRHVSPPPTALHLPRRQHAEPAGLWWVGAHGGAGESTLAALMPDTAAADHAWPVPTDGLGGLAPAVLLARTTAHGLTRAQGALTQWAAGLTGDVDLLGLVLLADAPGRLPTPLRHFADVVAGGAPRTWRLPWVEAWRMATPAEHVPLPAPVRRLARDVTRLVRS